MKKSFLFSLIVVVSLMLTAQASHAADLISDGGGGAGDDIGDVTITNNGNLEIKVTLASDAVVEYHNEAGDLIAKLDSLGIVEAHIHVADSADEIPQTGSGNPRPGKFDHKAEYASPGVQEHVLSLDALTPGDTVYIAVHVAVEGTYTQLIGEAPLDPPDEESAWGDGEDFSGKNWAMYIEYTAPILAPGRAPTTTYWGAIKAR
jgi:hypothetical protein